jgi:acyl-coenzyme A thioesterase PaaI-like protein
MTSPVVQHYYPEMFSHCYGCGRLNQDGIQLKSHWEGDDVVARYTPRPEHIAMPGFVYGGLIASLIDCHGMATAAAFAERQAGLTLGRQEAPRFVTASLHVDYLKPTPLGPELVLRARVEETIKRKLVVRMTLSAGGVDTARGEVVAAPLPPTMGG